VRVCVCLCVCVCVCMYVCVCVCVYKREIERHRGKERRVHLRVEEEPSVEPRHQLPLVEGGDWHSSRFKNNCFAVMKSSSEEGLYLRLVDVCITHL